MGAANRTFRTTGESTRARIIDAAAGVMTSKGLANTTTKEIARAAGYSEATLYKHFQDKEEIFFTVMRERLPAGFIQTLTVLPERAGQATVRENLRAVALQAVPFYLESTPMMAAVFAEPTLLTRHQDALRNAGEGPHRANAALTAYLHAEQQLGRISSLRRPEALAAMLLGACFQRAFLMTFVGEHVAEQSVEDFAAGIVDSLLFGDRPSVS
jgi:AcrR family transcriptional regulator